MFIKYETPNGGKMFYETDDLENFMKVVNVVSKGKAKVIDSSVAVTVVRHSEHDASQAVMWFNTRQEAKAFKLGLELAGNFKKVEFL